jgi:hypothetical protein
MALLDGVEKLTQLKLYETVVIGNFLYGLGFAISAKSKDPVFPSIVSLLQQNPMDQPLGDVLLEFSDGIVRLIEFKNKENKDKKEFQKHDNLMRDLQRMIIDHALKEMSERYEYISRSIHWFIETDPEEIDFTSRIVPYLDAFPTDDSRCADNRNFTFAEFVDLTADDAVNKRRSFPAEDLRAYLWYIAKLQIGLKKSGSKKDIPEAAGILLWIRSNGSIKVAGLPNMMYLKLQDREYIQQIHNQQEVIQEMIETNQNLKKLKALEQKLKPEHKMQKDHGLSL